MNLDVDRLTDAATWILGAGLYLAIFAACGWGCAALDILWKSMFKDGS